MSWDLNALSLAVSQTSRLLVAPSAVGQTLPACGLVLPFGTRPLDFLVSWLTSALMSSVLLEGC